MCCDPMKGVELWSRLTLEKKIDKNERDAKDKGKTDHTSVKELPSL